MAKKFKVNPRAKRVIEESRARIASKVDALLCDINVHVPRYTLQVVDGKDDTRKRGGVMVDQVFHITCLADVGKMWEEFDAAKRMVMFSQPEVDSIEIIIGVRHKR